MPDGSTTRHILSPAGILPLSHNCTDSNPRPPAAPVFPHHCCALLPERSSISAIRDLMPDCETSVWHAIERGVGDPTGFWAETLIPIWPA